jgi:hypothetical protein
VPTFARASSGSASRATNPRCWSTATVFAAACLETDRRRASSDALSAPAAITRSVYGSVSSTAGSMVSYEPQQWHDLFVAVADASGGLAGLIFVAVSLNHEQILSLPSLPPLAARSVSVLVALMLMSIFGLAPGQTYELLGIEILALGVVLLVGVVTVTLRGMSKTTPLRWKINLLSLALVSTVPMVIAGASTTLGVGGGLNWALADIVCGYIVSIYSAWILLIEIRR